MPTVTTKLDRRFLNTRVDPNDKVAFARWLMDVNLFLDDISRVVYSTYPLAGSDLSLAPYLKSADAAATYLTIANAISTYLSLTSAAAIYLTKADAATTYPTTVDVSTVYIAKTEIVRGQATLSGGTVTVYSPYTTANSLIQLTVNGAGVLANIGTIYEDQPTRSPGNYFVINSTNALSNATVAWQIMEP